MGEKIRRMEICFFAEHLPFEEAKVINDLIDYFQYRPLLADDIHITTSYGRVSSNLETYVVARAVVLGMNPEKILFREITVGDVPGVIISERV